MPNCKCMSNPQADRETNMSAYKQWCIITIDKAMGTMDAGYDKLAF